MRILIADKFEKSGVEGLKNLGCSVAYEPDTGAERLPEALARVQPDILIVRSTKVPAPVLKAAHGLRGIIRAGAGVDNIDIAAASQAAIAVCNCAGMNSIAVAELTMGLLLCCDRRIPDQTAELKAGKWNKKEFSGKAKGLKGMTLGVVGAGAIGRAVIKRALAFDMKILAWSLGITAEHARDLGAEWGGADTPSLYRLAGRCDAITIHLPAAPDTIKLIGKAFFDAMKPGAYLINTSRGSVVDEAALREAVRTKGLRCGLDVYENQPAAAQTDWKTPTADLPACAFTHHSGASTDQAQAAIADETVRIAAVFMQTGHWENCVNESALSAAVR